jgi:hypothetical protein
MSKNKPKRRKKNEPASDNQDGGSQDKNINGNMHVRGELEVKRSPSLEEQHVAERKEDSAQQGKTYRLERYGLCAVIIYALLTLWVAVSNHRAAGAAQSAADTAAKTLMASQDSIELDQRPWIFVSSLVLFSEPERGKPAPSISVSTTNTGKTPGIDVVSVYETLSSNGDPVNRELSTTEKIQYGLHPPGGGQSFAFKTVPINSAISNNAVVGLDAYRGGKSLIYIHGKLSYSDSFGNQYWTTFCAYHTYGTMLNLFTLCLRGNNVGQEKKNK